MSKAGEQTPVEPDSLDKLAALWGVQTSYEDVRGQRCESPAESIIAVLSLLGAPVSRFADIERALAERREALNRERLSPVSVLWEGASPKIEMRLPVTEVRGDFSAHLELEEGGEQSWTGRLEDLPDGPITSAVMPGGGVKWIGLREKLPLGYHRLALEVGAERYETLIIASPTGAYSPRGNGWERSWGVFLPLYSLESQQSWGAGDFRDLREQREWVQRCGGQIVGTLPLLAAFLDEPYEPSPYSPVSRLFWNEFYLNVPEVTGYLGSAEVRRITESAAFQTAIENVRSERLVDYRGVMKLKRQVLEKLAAAFFDSELPHSPERVAFDEYVRAHPALEDYAEFRALGERFRKPWPQWPMSLRDGNSKNAEINGAAKRYHMFAQWQADEQLQRAANREGGCGLYLDLPLGVNANGYDVWRERTLFGVGAAGGAPPDIVFPAGQNWGFVPLHPQNMRRDGYRYVRRFLQHQMRYANVLRIDHMPSFHRVYWVPAGASAKDGVYVRYPAEELYAVFALESRRHKTMIVGEDLGTVPREVPLAMARHNFHRMYVVEYEMQADPGATLPEPPAASIATINTHDMAPFAGYWSGRDLVERVEAGLLSASELESHQNDRASLRRALQEFLTSLGYDPVEGPAAALDACLAFLRDSPARMLLINLEDLWEETLSQNIPSTNGENANWRRKARHGAEEFRHNRDLQRKLRDVNDAIANRRSE